MKRVLWSNMPEKIKKRAEEIREEYPDFDEQDAFDLARYDIGNMLRYLQFYAENTECQIICYGCQTLSSGMVHTYREFKNLEDVFHIGNFDTEWYIDEEGDLRATVAHPDGINEYLYRLADDDAIDDVCDIIYNSKGKTKEELELLIKEKTESLYDVLLNENIIPE